MSLSEIVADNARRPAIVADAIAELHAEIDSVGGIKGKGIQAGLAAVNKVKPAFLEDNVRKLLPPFARALDPHYEQAKASGDINAHFVANSDAISEDLLAITDRRAQSSGNSVAVKLYNRLRGGAKAQVEQAMPRLAAFTERHGGQD